RKPFGLMLDVAGAFEELAPAELADARLLRGAAVGGRKPEHRPAVALQPKLDVEPREREAAHDGVDVRRLRAGRAHELTPGRSVVEEIPHLDGRAARVRGRTHVAELPAVRGDTKAAVGPGRPRRQDEARYRRDARQRLAAEPHRDERLEIVERRDLARRVPGQRERQLVRLDARAVVAHADQPGAAVLDLDVDTPCAGVERVLDELLHDGRGPLDHLAGGDLIDELRREDTNAHAAHCRRAAKKMAAAPASLSRSGSSAPGPRE